MKSRPSRGRYNMLYSITRQKYCTARKKKQVIVWRAKINAYLCIRNKNKNNNSKYDNL